MNTKFIRWILFSVILSLLPLFFLWLVNLAYENRDSSMEALVSRGELMLVTAILCATVIGDLIGHNSKNKIILLFFGFISVFLMLVSSSLYTLFAYPDLMAEKITDGYVFNTSVIVYVAALVSSSVCVYEVCDK